MEKIKKNLLPSILSIIPIFFMFISLYQVFDIYFGKGGYNFEVDNPYSIYRSKEIFLTYSIIASLVYGLNVFFAFKRNWGWYCVSLSFVILFIYYPTSSLAETV